MACEMPVPAGEETLLLRLLAEQRANSGARDNHVRVPARSQRAIAETIILALRASIIIGCKKTKY